MGGGRRVAGWKEGCRVEGGLQGGRGYMGVPSGQLHFLCV